MRRSRITITLTQDILNRVDQLVDHKKIRNRSHAIEYIITQFTEPRIRTAVVLAGGQGTNLRPYTYELPKSLLPVKSKPLLEHMIKQLKKNGITDIIICIGYLGDKIRDYFKDGDQFGVRIRYSVEDTPLKSGGALLKTRDMIGADPFLVVHGDIVTDLSFTDLIGFHMKEQPLVTVALTAINKPSEFGQLKLHGTRLVSFYDQTGAQDVRSHLVNCGIYVCDPQIFRYMPAGTDPFLLEDVIRKLIADRKVNGFVFSGQWYDVGNPDNYEEAIKEYKG